MSFAKSNTYLITQYVAKQRIITAQTLYHMLHRVTNRYYPMVLLVPIVLAMHVSGNMKILCWQ